MIPTVLANIVVEKFIEGGWVMWPILLTFLLSLCVILDRSIWWSALQAKIRGGLQEKAREALGTGDFATAWKMGENTDEPYLANLREGMSHANTSMLAAMQLHATHLIEKAEARMWVLSTMITLAPLLGLFGTVAGLMGSFAAIGSDQLAVTKVTGGIGEALIATACGIAIAVLCLLPYNFFRKRVSVLRSSLERWINHSELLVRSAKEHGHDLEVFAASVNRPR
ncbi:MAG: MotA/TolQ/ExbB proton channel family protein [Verrucomicrobiaceae bacterium]|nr:MAG: MotA/TolQ/ExbB proton channel family protein [Verrucomicrobiaceae bacterium]